MKNNIEKFLIYFNRLKSELNHSLKNLRWLPDASPETAELCYKLDETYIQLNRFFLNQPKKFSVVHPVFQKKWDEYTNSYKMKIQEIAVPIREKHDKELFELFELEAEKAELNGISKEDFWKKLTDDLPNETGMTFNPATDNAAYLLEEIFNLAYDSADLTPDGITDRHLGAMKYFEEVIGLNLKDINWRWGKVPNLFMSENIKKKTDKLAECVNRNETPFIINYALITSGFSCFGLLIQAAFGKAGG